MALPLPMPSCRAPPSRGKPQHEGAVAPPGVPAGNLVHASPGVWQGMDGSALHPEQEGRGSHGRGQGAMPRSPVAVGACERDPAGELQTLSIKFPKGSTARLVQGQHFHVPSPLTTGAPAWHSLPKAAAFSFHLARCCRGNPQDPGPQCPGPQVPSAQNITTTRSPSFGSTES